MNQYTAAYREVTEINNAREANTYAHIYKYYIYTYNTHRLCFHTARNQVHIQNNYEYEQTPPKRSTKKKRLQVTTTPPIASTTTVTIISTITTANVSWSVAAFCFTKLVISLKALLEENQTSRG